VTGSSGWQEFTTSHPIALETLKHRFGTFGDGPSLSVPFMEKVIDTGDLGNTKTAVHIGGKGGTTIPMNVSGTSIGGTLFLVGFSYFR
jgi:hypothetical protein